MLCLLACCFELALNARSNKGACQRRGCADMSRGLLLHDDDDIRKTTTAKRIKSRIPLCQLRAARPKKTHFEPTRLTVKSIGVSSNTHTHTHGSTSPPLT